MVRKPVAWSVACWTVIRSVTVGAHRLFLFAVLNLTMAVSATAAAAVRADDREVADATMVMAGSWAGGDSKYWSSCVDARFSGRGRSGGGLRCGRRGWCHVQCPEHLI